MRVMRECFWVLKEQLGVIGKMGEKLALKVFLVLLNVWLSPILFKLHPASEYLENPVGHAFIVCQLLLHVVVFWYIVEM